MASANSGTPRQPELVPTARRCLDWRGAGIDAQHGPEGPRDEGPRQQLANVALDEKLAEEHGGVQDRSRADCPGPFTEQLTAQAVGAIGREEQGKHGHGLEGKLQRQTCVWKAAVSK